MRDSSGEPERRFPTFSGTALGSVLPRLSDFPIGQLTELPQARYLARQSGPELIQKSGDAISRVFAKTLTI